MQMIMNVGVVSCLPHRLCHVDQYLVLLGFLSDSIRDGNSILVESYHPPGDSNKFASKQYKVEIAFFGAFTVR